MEIGQYYLKVLLIMVVLFAFILPGYLLRKTGLIEQDALRSFSNVLLYVCQPMMFIKAFCVDPVAPTKELGINLLLVGIFAFLGMVGVYLIARLCFLKTKERRTTDIYTFLAVFSNCGFIGIPFVDMLTDGNSVAMMYVTMYNVVFNLLVWTLGVYLMTQNKKDVSLFRAFVNPSVVGVAISLVFFLIPQINIFNMEGVKPLRQIPVYLGEMTAPLSMLIVGARAADLSLRDIFCNKGDYFGAFLRLIVAPAVMLALVLPFKLTGVLGVDNYVFVAPVIAIAMTPASTVVAYAEKFGGEKQVAARTFISTTLLGIITIPLVITFISVI